MTKPKQKNTLTASKLRVILSVLLVAILLVMVGGFYLAYGLVKDTAKATAETQAQAQSSDAKLQNLKLLEKQLEGHSDTRQKAKQIVAESQSYQYQNQIIGDLTNYANQAGVSIVSFNFSDLEPVAPENTATPENGDEAGSGEAPTPAVSAGLKSIMASIQLGNDTNYNNLLYFMHLVENNLTRMQISDLFISSGETGDTVSVQNLNIEVYIR